MAKKKKNDTLIKVGYQLTVDQNDFLKKVGKEHNISAAQFLRLIVQNTMDGLQDGK